MEELIYDRTSDDVTTALNNPDITENLKGSYNYTDLNRVESWCKYIENIFKNYGFTEELSIKTDWTMTDFPTRTQIDRIRNNIDILKEFCYALATEEIIYNNTLNYEQANVLEKILFDIKDYIDNITVTLNVKYNFATVLIKRELINLNVEEE